MILAERDTTQGLLVTVCDRELLGETVGNEALSFTVNESFYGGEEADESAVVQSLSRATIANLVGTRSVELAISEGFVDEANVLAVGETLHAQFLRL